MNNNVTRWPRFKRGLKWLGISLLAAIVLLAGSGAIYEFAGKRSAARDYPPPGQLVDIGGRNMHLDCRGSGSPTVVFEAGLGTGGSLDWALVHDAVAGITRACAYDRAGIMWSDPKSTPQDAVAIADDLHATLAAAGISGPLVLVGHSIGGPYVTTYVGKHGEQVAGLVLVDPSHPEQAERLQKVTNQPVNAKDGLGKIKLASALSGLGIVRLAMRGKGDPRVPAEISAAKEAYGPKSLKGALSEIEGRERSMQQAMSAHDFDDRPLLVLTAMAPFTPSQIEAMGHTPEVAARIKDNWKQLNAEQTAWSTRGQQRLLGDATHYIQFDRPDAVISAIQETVNEVRGAQAGGTPAAPAVQADEATQAVPVAGPPAGMAVKPAR